MFSYEVKKLDERIFSIRDAAGVLSYLAVGTKKAVLVDTGVGFPGLKDTVASITPLPCSVILTHGHLDHAGGIADFEDVYVMHEDIPVIYSTTRKDRAGFAQSSMPQDITVSEECMLPDVSPDRRFHALKDGMLFDLGSLTLETIAVPGHTHGSAAVLFREPRMILLGDCCNSNTLVAFPEAATISVYQTALKKLLQRKSEFDTILHSHGPEIGSYQNIEENLELCDRILSRTDAHIEIEFLGRVGYLAAPRTENGFDRVDGKFGNIMYSDRTAK